MTFHSNTAPRKKKRPALKRWECRCGADQPGWRKKCDECGAKR